ncbi:MAG TPA: hypothetical protein VNS88_05580 [Nitrospiraceae bacterium]|nr:hypothetical protein [Nitrospiraceae bacterium]
MPGRTTKNELRCFCSREPLLAVYGVKDKKLYVHIKIYKQRRIYGEALITEGKVKLHCRECLRWHTVTLRDPDKAILLEDPDPPTLPVEA